ncbi:MAG: MBL fold metallo-hydrolase [Chlamydiales bacterium]|nr:MBL fold metallo-hydrolase [Chlamydiales bacterium]
MKWVFVCLLLCGCGKPMPTPRNAVDIVRKSAPELAPNSADYQSTLQVKWLGTASYIIQLGDILILTDPFYSYHSMITTGIGDVKSDPSQVAKIAKQLRNLPKPKAVFVGHSHYDHLLDVAELFRQMQWMDVPIIGSPTTRNILAGYHQGLEKLVHLAQVDDEWHSIGPGLRYKAFAAQHAPHLKGVELYSGSVTHPYSHAPKKANQFKCGPVYSYIFELTTPHVERTIYFTGAATNAPIGFPDPSVQSVDLAILCVPGWRLVRGYPIDFVRRLRAPFIMASHYDDFFHKRGRREVIFADLQGFIDEVLRGATYPAFREVLIPAVGTRVNF